MPSLPRKSNVELARILAMFLITAHHCVYHSRALSFVEGFNRDVSLFWLFGGKAGVDVFVLLSAYFLYGKTNTVRQFVRVWCTTFFYFVSILLLSLFVLRVPMTRGEIIRDLLPVLGGRNWFVSTFCIWLLLVPVLNAIVRNASPALVHAITAILFLLECVLPTLHETHCYANLAFFVFLFFLMAEYRRGTLDILKRKSFCRVALVSSVAVVFAIGKFAGSLAPAMDQFSPFNLMFACSLVALCLNARTWYSRPVNMLAKATYGIFLLHTGNPIRGNWLWPQVFRCDRFFASPWYWAWIPASVCAIFAAGFLAECFRVHFLETPLQKSPFYQRLVKRGENAYDRFLGQ
ncbi:MAG: acyltransferase [Kiritimatiellae bacterium]|nr:acyltransferase [Kiritimatiellia bacterium]